MFFCFFLFFFALPMTCNHTLMCKIGGDSLQNQDPYISHTPQIWTEGQGMVSLAQDEDWKPEEMCCLTLHWLPGTWSPTKTH